MNILIQGAGRGIGLALAHRAVAADAKQLFLTARQPETSPGFSDLPPGPNIHWIPMDNLQPDSIEKAGAQLCQQIDRLDRVITCAGVLKDDSIKPEKRIADIDATALLQAFQVNATGPVLLAKAVWPLLRGEHRLHFASLSARVGSITDNRLGGWYAYRASKAAQNQLMRTLAIELARHNPKACVASLHPGTVDTDLSKPFQGNLGNKPLFTTAHCAAQLWQVLDQLDERDSGGFFAYDGSSIPF